MPLRLPRPPAELIEAFEAERQRSGVVEDAIIAGLMRQGATPDSAPAREPRKMWMLGAIPVEGLPKGSAVDADLMSSLRIRCWRFFVGLDDGSHVELDFRNGAVIAAAHVAVGEDRCLSYISRAILLWARQTGGNNEARLVELPHVNIRAVRAIGPDPGVILDELWSSGSHGRPMDEDDFVGHVLHLWKRRQAASRQGSSGTGTPAAGSGAITER